MHIRGIDNEFSLHPFYGEEKNSGCCTAIENMLYCIYSVFFIDIMLNRCHERQQFISGSV